MALEKIQNTIDKLPKQHRAMPYRVAIKDRRGEVIDIRFVRASSEKRAELTGLKINRYMFGNKKSHTASAWPFGWRMDQLKPWQVFANFKSQ